MKFQKLHLQNHLPALILTQIPTAMMILNEPVKNLMTSLVLKVSYLNPENITRLYEQLFND